MLATVAAAIYAGATLGWEPLRAGRWIWIAGAAFLAWTACSLVYGRALSHAYEFRTHLVTYGKYVEYTLLAPSLSLLFRRARDAAPFTAVLAVWSAFATAVGAAQFFGAPIFLKGTFGHRQASFLSSAEFAALSSATLVLGVVALLLPTPAVDRRVARLALLAGALGVVLAAALASVLGLLLAGVCLVAALAWRGMLPRRRLVALSLAGAVLVVGAVSVRHKDVGEYVHFSSGRAHRASHVETYAQRELLAYIGVRMFADHPVLGVGFEGSSEQHRVEPYLADARRKFPNENEEAFPSRQHPWGVQDLYLQVLTDTGVLGLALLVALYASAFVLAAGAARTRAESEAALGVLGLLWLALTLGLWTAQGWVAGVGLDALTWWAFGLAATGAAWRRAQV